jgi:diguanylate cyclase (GGDEF)-like protein/PAS domain S-box-containing protein
MYQYTLNIYILSDNIYIQNAIEGVKPEERFEHRISTVTAYEGAVRDGDIFIVDGREELLPEIYSTKRSTAIVVYYGKEPKECSNFDAYWGENISRDMLVFYFTSVLKRIKNVKELKLSRNYLDTLINNTPDLVWFKDKEGAHVKVNDSFCRAVNKTKKQVEGRGHYYIWDLTPEDYSKGEYVCLESEDMVMEKGESMIFDEKVKTKDGMRLFVTTKSPIFDEFHRIMGTVGQAKDVTQLNNISMEMSLFLENMPFGVIVSDNADIITNTNSPMEKLTGRSKDSMLGTTARMDNARVLEMVEDTPDKKVCIMEVELCGESKTLEMTKMHLTDVFKNAMGLIRIFRDITVERRLEMQVIKSANTDFLTGLYNRRYFYDYIKNYCIGAPMGLFSLDLDNFKSVNDTYGHQKGDEVLVLVADVLREVFGKHLVVRNGGDEFIVVVTDAERDEIEALAQSAIARLNAACAEKEEFANVTASIGVAVSPRFDGKVDAMLQKSDMALYSVKKNDKGNYCIVS